MYLAYEVPEKARNELASLFPPKYPDFIGHHVTKVFGVSEVTVPDESKSDITVIGHMWDDGVETLVVDVNGSPHRPDGKVYHITWSLDRSLGKTPRMSNDLLEKRGWFVVLVPYTFEAELRLYT